MIYLWIHLCLCARDSQTPVQSLRHTCAVEARSTMSPWRGAAPLSVPHLVLMRGKVRRYHSFKGVCELGPSWSENQIILWEHLVSFSWWKTDLKPVHKSVFPLCASTWLYQTVWVKSLVHSSLNTFLCVTRFAVNWPVLQHNKILQQFWESSGASCANNPFTQPLQTVAQNAVYYKRRDVSVHAVL